MAWNKSLTTSTTSPAVSSTAMAVSVDSPLEAGWHAAKDEGRKGGEKKRGVVHGVQGFIQMRSVHAVPSGCVMRTTTKPVWSVPAWPSRLEVSLKQDAAIQTEHRTFSGPL